ncbi:MAG: DUF1097 family protein [Oscillospiraceae bacterium]|nr:DUF1097 family protein [Oscillospiraceae bacterium]
MNKKEIIAKIVSISGLPAIWCLAAILLGIGPAPAAMVSATMYVIYGKKAKPAIMTVSIILSVIFAYCIVSLIGALTANASPAVVTPLVLFIGVGIIIVIQELLKKFTDLPTILGGFATGMLGLTMVSPDAMPKMGIELVIAMLVGLWWIGVLGDVVMGAMMKEKK